ncbi:hypothetical protein [Virgibacillus salexigens]|uniref:Phage portal protein n=1 Tax=Virgibacillus massiliensis TaxID=1462526 RepID=A0A024QH41_9BACI|nr:hypothetical protein [Virgibacillus massiliensis]CDQ41829.1 hypothetical protein BN990_04206 [Virgibacillus massiliensis]
MSKLFYNLFNNIRFNNATSPSSSSGSRSSINRDPKTAKAKRVGYQISNSSGGGGGRDNFETHDVDLTTIANAIRKDGYLTQGVMKYEELIFKSGWNFKSKNEQALDYLKLRLEMMEVATGTPVESLFHGIARDIVWSSNCFIAKARAKNGAGLPPGVSLTPVPPSKEPVVGYFILPPQTISIARDENGTVTKYQQEVEGGGDAIEFNPEDIIHIATNVRSGSAFGDPWLAPVIEDIRLLRKVEENASLLLYKHIFPLLKYKVGENKDGFEATDEEIEQVQATVDGMTEDSIFVIPERHNVEAVNVDAIDGRPYLDYFENRVFAGMGLSQVDFGRGNTANRNTADAMTGQKADRVKGWQKVLQTAIDKFIIDELLIEGGYDPLVNPDFNVDFVFNEIEQERLIAKENHEIHKFLSDIQTWEETRANMGQEPTADESRLRYQMIGATDSDPAANATQNKNQPQNQHGKKDGPKRATEFTKDTMNGITNESETNFKRSLIDSLWETEETLNQAFNHMKASVLEQIETKIQRLTFPLEESSNLFSFNRLERDRFQNEFQKQTIYLFNKGVDEAHSKIKGVGKINESLAHNTIKTEIEEQLDRIETRISSITQSNLDKFESEKDVMSSVASAFEAVRSSVKSNAKTLLAKSYNYGYSLVLMQEDEEYASVYYEGDCKACQRKNKEPIPLKQLSSLDEVAIFYKIPPWHPNCECEVTKFKGGEM